MNTREQMWVCRNYSISVHLLRLISIMLHFNKIFISGFCSFFLFHTFHFQVHIRRIWYIRKLRKLCYLIIISLLIYLLNDSCSVNQYFWRMLLLYYDIIYQIIPLFFNKHHIFLYNAVSYRLIGYIDRLYRSITKTWRDLCSLIQPFPAFCTNNRTNIETSPLLSLSAAEKAAYLTSMFRIINWIDLTFSYVIPLFFLHPQWIKLRHSNWLMTFDQDQYWKPTKAISFSRVFTLPFLDSVDGSHFFVSGCH